MGRCQAPPCTNVVADVTRNGRQRFCSVRCANRVAVRRHRARRLSSGAVDAATERQFARDDFLLKSVNGVTSWLVPHLFMSRRYR
ncbi:CGNR zinc finger domain-containing protein [Microbacterium tenebrionis]|uniref:CGNR zinc finger domain-containing protein n=1 Tax=Microbacterium tenebrionis TaxID=2830665 RepID=UPI001D0D7459|nr:CGNR zinc finger domain-containing protein [Microbacterium tenebrionis]